MNNKKNLILAIIILLFLAAITFFLFWYLNNLSPTLLTLVAGSIGFLIKTALDQNRESENRIFEKKEAVYGHILRQFKNILSPNNRDNINKDLTKEQLSDLFESSFNLLTFASDDVVKEFVRFRNSSVYGNPDPVVLLIIVANFILAIRKDLGYKNTKLNQIDILAMFVNFKPEEIESISKVLGIKYQR